MSDLTVKLKLTADGKLLSSEVKRAEKNLDAMGRSGTRAGDGINRGVTKSRRGLESISKQLSRTKTQLLSFFAAGASFAGIKSIIQTGDDLTLLDARLRQATQTQAAYAQAQRDVLAIARGARADYEATANLYSRMALSAQAYNVTQQQVADTTAAVTYGLKLYGATGAEAQSTTLQLAQALSSGKLAGDEFRSMAEASPRLMQALADALQVPRGALKDLAAQGKLTTEVVINALSSQRQAMETEFKQMPVTVGEAVGQLVNNIKLKFAEFNKSSEFTAKIAQSILLLENNLEGLLSIVTPVVAGLIAFTAARFLPILLATISARAVTAGISMTTLATRAGVANTALGILRGTMLLLGGPAGVFALAVTGAFLLKQQLDKNTAASKLAARAATLEAEATDLAAYAADVATKESKELTKALEAKAQAHLQNAKAALIDAQAEAQVRRNLLSKYKDNKKTWTSGSIRQTGKLTNKEFDSYVNTAGQELKTAENNVKRLLGVVESAKAQIKSINDNTVDGAYKGLGDRIAKINNGLNNLGQTASTSSNKLKTGVTAAREALANYNNSLKDIDDAKKAGLITDAEYVRQKARLSLVLDQTTGASQLLSAQLDDMRPKARKTGGAMSDLSSKVKASASNIKGTSSSVNVSKNVIEEYTQKVVALASSLSPTISAQNEYAKATETLNGAKKAGIITEQTHANLLEKATQRFNDATSAAKRYSDIMSLFPQKVKLDSVNKKIKKLTQLLSDPKGRKELGKTYGEIVKIRAAHINLADAVSANNPELIKKYEAQVAALEKVGGAAEKNAGTVQDVFKSALNGLDGVFKNTWKSIFNGSKDLGNALKDWFKNLLAELAHAAITRPIVLSITSAFAGGANAQGLANQAGGGGFGGGLFSLFSPSGGIASGITNLGSTLGIQFGTNFINGASGAIGGLGVGGMLAGLTGGNSTTGALGGALGGLVGNIILPGIGGWIGSALGGLLGGLFGKKKKRNPYSQMYTFVNSGEIDKDGARKLGQDQSSKPQKVIVDNIKAMSDAFGVRLSDDLIAGFKIRTDGDKKGMVAIFETYLKNSANKIYKAKTDAKTLEDPKKFALEVARISLATVVNKQVTDWSGKTSAQRGLVDKLQTQDSIAGLDINQVNAITTWLKNIEDQARKLEATTPNIKSVFDGIKGTATEYVAAADGVIKLTQTYGQTALDTVVTYAKSLNSAGDLVGKDLARITSAFTLVTETAIQLNLTLPSIGNGFVEVADKLVQAIGGAQKFAKLTANYYSKFFTKSERELKAYTKAHDTFARVQRETGSSAITSAASFRQYIESLDLTTDAGRRAYATAMQYADAVYAADQAMSLFKNAFERITDTFKNIRTKIEETLLSPEQLYNKLKQENEALAQALKNAKSPAEIEEITKNIQALTARMWDSLNKQQQASMQAWFVKFLDDSEALAKKRLDELEAQAKPKKDDLNSQTELARQTFVQAQQSAQIIAQSGETYRAAAEQANTAASNMNTAAAGMGAAASELAGATASIPARIDVHNHVTVKSPEVGGL